MRQRLDNVILQLRAAHEAAKSAQRGYEYLLAPRLKPGDELSYLFGEHIIGCTFIEARGDRVRVRGGSGKEYDIGAYRIESVWR